MPKDDESFEEEPIQDNEEEIETFTKGEGEPVIEKPTVDGFFAYENELLSIEKTMLGFSPRDNVWVYTSQPMARDGFINAMINSLRSIIKQGSYLGSLDEDEVKTILLEKNYEFAGSVYLEPTVEDDDAEKIINMHDHMLELFLKTLRDGLGNDTFRQVSANVYSDKKDQNAPLVNWEAIGIKK